MGRSASNRLQRRCVSLCVLLLTYAERNSAGEPSAAKKTTHLLFFDLSDGGRISALRDSSYQLAATTVDFNR